jgi:O-methyltransferase
VIKRILRKALARMGYQIVRSEAPPDQPRLLDGSALPDGEFYAPLFSPWLGYGRFADYHRLAAPYTLVSPDRCWVLYCLARQAFGLGGEFWECGVYRGGTARLLAQLLADDGGFERLRLFDTFAGMPETDASRDYHKQGDFADTSMEAVRDLVGHPGRVTLHPGFIPATFAGLEDARIAFAHVDVDIYRSVIDCCEFILPRLATGGVLIFDDYGFPTCPGARRAVDESFSITPFVPLVLPTGQAIVFKTRKWAGPKVERNGV